MAPWAGWSGGREGEEEEVEEASNQPIGDSQRGDCMGSSHRGTYALGGGYREQCILMSCLICDKKESPIRVP